MKLLGHDYIENNCCLDTSYMREKGEEMNSLRHRD